MSSSICVEVLTLHTNCINISFSTSLFKFDSLRDLVWNKKQCRAIQALHYTSLVSFIDPLEMISTAILSTPVFLTIRIDLLCGMMKKPDMFCHVVDSRIFGTHAFSTNLDSLPFTAGWTAHQSIETSASPCCHDYISDVEEVDWFLPGSERIQQSQSEYQFGTWSEFDVCDRQSCHRKRHFAWWL